MGGFLRCVIGEKMKILMLSGPGSSGKTTSLNLLYTQLLTVGKSTNKQQLGANQNDFSDVVNYMNLQIAFFTMGDYSTYLINAMKNYSSQSMDILICACNSKFVKPYKEIKKYPNFSFIQKSITIIKQDEFVKNTIDANVLFNLI